MASELVEELRNWARRLRDDGHRTILVDAADALEAYELAERERLEREAVTPESGLPHVDWPVIPWPSNYPDHASYHKAMVGWHKTITRIQRLEGT